jgi:hypothetical protein
MDSSATHNELVATKTATELALEAVAQGTVEAEKYLAAVKDFVIDSPEMYEIAAAELTNIRNTEKNLEELRDKIVRPLNTEVKSVNAKFKAPAAILADAKAVLGPKMNAYEAQDRIEREARERKAAADRDEAARIAAEQLAEAQASGDAEAVHAAEVSLAMAEIDVGGIAGHSLDRGGHSKRVTWTSEVLRLPLLLRYIADSLERGEETFNNTVDIKPGQLNKFADATKGTVAIPGVKFHREEKLIAVARS